MKISLELVLLVTVKFTRDIEVKTYHIGVIGRLNRHISLIR